MALWRSVSFPQGTMLTYVTWDVPLRELELRRNARATRYIFNVTPRLGVKAQHERVQGHSGVFKSNQITFIVTSPQHKCLGEWNSYERAPDSAKKKKQQFTYGQTVQKNNNNLHMDRQCKKTTNNLHMDRQCKKTTTIYIWTVHIYRLYRRQCAKYTYIYSVHIVYYKDTLNYQRHIIHLMGTSTLCTLSIHNVVYT